MNKSAVNTTNILEIAPQITVKRLPPKNIVKEDLNLFKHEFKKTFPPVYSSTFHKVSILPNGAVRNILLLTKLYFCNSIKQRGLVFYKSRVKLYLESFNRYFKTRHRVRIEKALLVNNLYSCNFFHWMCEVLPKLELISNQFPELQNHTIVLPVDCDTVYARYTLNKYHLEYHFIKRNEQINAKELVHIPTLSPSGNYRPSLIQRINTRFTADHDSRDIDAKRIYISRKKAPYRKLINEDIITPILQRFGFEIIVMEDLTIDEQINKLKAADVLLSIHGAGLANMLWMPKESKIVEIREKNDQINNAFFSLASALNLKYFYILADKTDDQSTQKTNFVIDVESFESKLKSILNDY